MSESKQKLQLKVGYVEYSFVYFFAVIFIHTRYLTTVMKLLSTVL